MNRLFLLRVVSVVFIVPSIPGCDKHRAHVDPEEADRLGQKMVLSLRDGDVQQAKNLFKQGANPNAAIANGLTVLMAACTSKCLDHELIQSLINEGADVNAKGPGDRTALWVAAASGDIDIVKALLKAGAEVNTGNRKAGTPLVAAADGGYKDIVMELLAAGADVNGQDINGVTALGRFADLGNVEMVQHLLGLGADPTIPSVNKHGVGTVPRARVSILLSLVGDCRNDPVRLSRLEPEARQAVKDGMAREADLVTIVKMLETAEADKGSPWLPRSPEAPILTNP